MAHEASSSGINDIEVVSTESISDSKYIKPMRVTYRQAGIQKTWDYMKVHNSVAILIFNVTSQSIVLVRQFRPAIYMTDMAAARESGQSEKVNGCDGVTYELCAGIIDRDAEPCEIASSEVLEETGYKIAADKLEFISKYRSGVGVSGNMQHLFYAEVTDAMKVSEGGGCEHEGEMIELFHVKVSQLRSFMYDSNITNRPVGVLFAILWFLENKMKK